MLHTCFTSEPQQIPMFPTSAPVWGCLGTELHTCCDVYLHYSIRSPHSQIYYCILCSHILHCIKLSIYRKHIGNITILQLERHPTITAWFVSWERKLGTNQKRVYGYLTICTKTMNSGLFILINVLFCGFIVFSELCFYICRVLFHSLDVGIKVPLVDLCFCFVIRQ